MCIRDRLHNHSDGKLRTRTSRSVDCNTNDRHHPNDASTNGNVRTGCNENCREGTESIKGEISNGLHWSSSNDYYAFGHRFWRRLVWEKLQQ